MSKERLLEEKKINKSKTHVKIALNSFFFVAFLFLRFKQKAFETLQK